MLVTIEIIEDEVLVAIKRPEGYENVHPELVAEDAIRPEWAHYRTIQPLVVRSNCMKRLREQNMPYPRTCMKCGLGPCREGP